MGEMNSHQRFWIRRMDRTAAADRRRSGSKIKEETDEKRRKTPLPESEEKGRQ